VSKESIVDMPGFTRWIDANYIDGHLAEAIEAKHYEIMINCKEYYAVLYKSHNSQQMWDYQDMKEVVNHESN